MNNRKVEKSLIESIGNDTVKSFTKDFGELLIDSMIIDDSLKSIPVISTIFNLGKAGLNLRDHILMKKIVQFLFETDSLGYKEKKEFIESVNYNSKYRARVGEQLLLFLDRIDDLEKPIIIGKLFKNCVNKNISYDTFLRLSSIVIRVFTPDIISLNEYNSGKNISKVALENLTNQGLLSLDLKSEHKQALSFKGIENKDHNSLSYELNELSYLLIKFGLE